jgi:tetratricopeptide (TPR) repeat protein
MRKPFILLALAALCAAVPLHAQQAPPPRPNLPRGADPNDWEAYFSLGERQWERLPARAETAFYWASRLDPTRAEPLFARWAAFYAHDWGTWLSYVEDDERIMQQPEVMENQALRERAYYRNPFVHRGFEAALWSRMMRRRRLDGSMRAFMSYGAADFPAAVDGFGRTVRANPERNARFRFWRALAFVGNHQADSAAVELTALLATLRQQDEQRLSEFYESKAMLEYALGMLYEAGGQFDEARRAYERAMEEDLSMYAARAALGRMARREGHVAEAVDHLAQAVEIAPGDAVMQYEYGNALLAAGRYDEAVAALQLAVQLEPWWAEPYLRLGAALEGAGSPGKAAAAFRAFVERAPRRLSDDVQRANERIATLGQAGG